MYPKIRKNCHHTTPIWISQSHLYIGPTTHARISHRDRHHTTPIWLPQFYLQAGPTIHTRIAHCEREMWWERDTVVEREMRWETNKSIKLKRKSKNVNKKILYVLELCYNVILPYSIILNIFVKSLLTILDTVIIWCINAKILYMAFALLDANAFTFSINKAKVKVSGKKKPSILFIVTLKNSLALKSPHSLWVKKFPLSLSLSTNHICLPLFIFHQIGFFKRSGRTSIVSQSLLKLKKKKKKTCSRSQRAKQ